MLLPLSFVVLYIGNRLWFRLDSSLVGFLFFALGYKMKDLLKSIESLPVMRKVVGLLACILLCAVAAYFNLDFSNRQGLSINACYFGKYPPLFLLSGTAGACGILFLSALFRHQSRFITQISNGTIVILGFHWIVFTEILSRIYVADTVIGAIVISMIDFIICYGLILLSQKYFPVLLGNRKLCSQQTKP